MRLKNIFLLYGISIALCGNTFAYSPYADTIKQSIQPKSFLSIAFFPKTVADVSFVERIENKSEGYKPYFNRSAFSGMTVQEQDELESMAYRAEMDRQRLFNTVSLEEYCKNYPLDFNYCPETAVDTKTDEVLYGSIYPSTSSVTDGRTPYMRAALTSENISKYDLKTYNGGCTPPERSDHWNNSILTSGKFINIAPAFEKFMITAFRNEGGCANNQNDRGGYTCYGCASNGLCNGVDFKTLTRTKVEDLAYSKIYKQYNVDKIPDAFRGYLLWGMWGSGSVTGIKQFQGALGVPQTGKIDDATIQATETYTGDFAETYTRNREQFLRNIVARDSSQTVFLNGWLKGLKLLQPSGCHIVPTNPLYR